MPILNSVRGTFGATSNPTGSSLTSQAGANLPFDTNTETQWFSPAYFGVETAPSYKLRNGSTINTVTYRRVNTGVYHWWFTVVSSPSANVYNPIYGAVITTPSGGTVGETLTFNLSDATITFGSRLIPASGDYYISWHSGTGGYPGLTQATGALYGVVGGTHPGGGAPEHNTQNGQGSISWFGPTNSVYPQLNVPWTASSAQNWRSHVSISVGYSIPTTSTAIDGSTPEKAAPSAKYLLDRGITTSGWYWIRPTSTCTPQYVYCDQSTNGGGWMLMSWISSSQFRNWHVGDAEINPLANGGCTTMLTNVSTANSGSNKGYMFIDAIVTANRGACVAKYTLTGGAGASSHFFFNTNANSRYHDYFRRSCHSINANSFNGNENLAGNQWLKTCNTGYTTAGGGGAGVATGGTNITYLDQRWGVFPFNMNGNYSSNWGSAIDPYYNTQAGGSYTAPIYASTPVGLSSGHNSGWGQSVAFWLKTGT